MEQNGFTVVARDKDMVELNRRKSEAGISTDLMSCHTARVGGYVIEGHVPADLVKRMLRERPQIAGLAVPGDARRLARHGGRPQAAVQRHCLPPHWRAGGLPTHGEVRMLRQSPVVWLLLALPLAGCASITAPAANGTTVFEVEYVNYAWVPTWRGFVIDSTGTINSYDRKGKAWQPGNADYPTRAELVGKYAVNSKPAGSVEVATFRAMEQRAGAAAAGPVSDPVNRCADAGTITYSAWLYDSEQDAFRRVLLWREGDVAQLNQSAAGRAIADWLRSLQLVPGFGGCQPE